MKESKWNYKEWEALRSQYFYTRVQNKQEKNTGFFYISQTESKSVNLSREKLITTEQSILSPFPSLQTYLHYCIVSSGADSNYLLPLFPTSSTLLIITSFWWTLIWSFMKANKKNQQYLILLKFDRNKSRKEGKRRRKGNYCGIVKIRE